VLPLNGLDHLFGYFLDSDYFMFDLRQNSYTYSRPGPPRVPFWQLHPMSPYTVSCCVTTQHCFFNIIQFERLDDVLDRSRKVLAIVACGGSRDWEPPFSVDGMSLWYE
jgi:hypothetical protein